ncbi:MAG TPA: hypothetical protein VKT77_05475 [Chthonomonadaceae bacterium]|nr:hypothetical protein [Chthonomonadaceae bacterium]
MPHPTIASDVIDRRGKAWYELHLRDIVETDENIGKQIVIDIETGEYEIDNSGLDASLRMLRRNPNAALYGIRIGYDAAYAIGASLTRTATR